MILYGASGHAKVIIDSLIASNINVNGLFDDNPTIKQILGYKVFGVFNKEVLGSDKLIISIGLNDVRKRIVESLPRDIIYGTAMHPTAIISKFATIGFGSVVMQGAIIQSCANIGHHCIINTAATIDHDCLIEDFVHISPNATLCGGVEIGEGCQIGAGAVIIPGVKIGKWSIVGAGAVVAKDLPANCTAVGVPAKVIKSI